jgi:hypothetical protein
LVAAAGLRDARGPRDSLFARGQFEHREAAIERRRPRVSACGERAIGRDEHRRDRFVDTAAEDIYAGGFCFVDYRVCVATNRLPFAIGFTTIAALGNEIRYFAIELFL